MTGRDALADWIAPARTALLVVDMQVDFAAPEGVLGRTGVDLSTVPAALAAAERLANAARAAGVLVVLVGLSTSPQTDSPAWRERVRRLGGDPDVDMAICRSGQMGSVFVGPQPGPGDWIEAKTRYSPFGHGPRDQGDLAQRLRARGVDTLVVCGLTTECCVDCTVRDAFALDFHVFVAADACAAYEPDLHDGALKALGLSFALITNSQDVVSAWRAP